MIKALRSWGLKELVVVMLIIGFATLGIQGYLWVDSRQQSQINSWRNCQTINGLNKLVTSAFTRFNNVLVQASRDARQTEAERQKLEERLRTYIPLFNSQVISPLHELRRKCGLKP